MTLVSQIRLVQFILTFYLIDQIIGMKKAAINWAALIHFLLESIAEVASLGIKSHRE